MKSKKLILYKWIYKMKLGIGQVNVDNALRFHILIAPASLQLFEINRF